MENFVDKLSTFFGKGDTLPWTDPETIAKCEREASGQEPGLTSQSENAMRLAWALVHSHRDPDVQRGIAMLEAQLMIKTNPADKREVLYLLAVGYFRLGDYARSRKLIDQALEISPDFRQAKSLRKMVEDKIKADGVIGIGIAAGAAALLAGGVAVIAAAAGKRH